MPFSNNKDIHVVFNENVRAGLTEEQLKQAKKEIIARLKRFQEKGIIEGGIFEIKEGKTKPGWNKTISATVQTTNPSTVGYVTPLGIQDPSHTKELLHPYVRVRPMGTHIQEQSLSKNALQSSYQLEVASLVSELQSDVVFWSDEEIAKEVAKIKSPSQYKKRMLDIKNIVKTTKNILTSNAAQKIISDVYTLTLLGFSAVLMNVVGFGAEGNNNVPEAIVGPVPLYSVQSMERSRSDRIVKYRAIGDVFLAHQRGTKDSLRIDGTLFGPYRNIYIIMLLTLQQRGEQRLESIKNIATLSQAQSALNENIVQGGDKNTVPMYEKHETFPIITQTSIMLDMFLQTIEWNESIENGRQCIKYHLLFRKYIEPKGWEALSTDEESIKKFNLDYTDTLSQRRRKELMYDVMWKLRKAGGELYRGAWTGGKSRDDWIKETTSYAPMLYALRPATLAHIARGEMIGENYG